MLRLIALLVVLGLTGLTLSGCGKSHDESHDHDHHESHGHDHDEEKAHGKHDGHGHGKEASGGASFRPGQGLTLGVETRQSLGVETAEVIERRLPVEIRFNAQVYGENHRPSAQDTEHAECTAQASGLLDQAATLSLRAGQPVRLKSPSGEMLSGIVLRVNKSLAIGDAEIVVGVTNAGAKLKPGEFLLAGIPLPRTEPVAAVPNSAVLRAADGTFVYRVNGDAYLRTAVRIGAEADGWVEISDGLLSGDLVVTKPVEELWLIELRATKGGGHSH